jgi:hypothetical protein
MSLATLCIATLVIKRQHEIPRRDWLIWSFDVMKQSIGSSFSHFSNIFVSELIAADLTSDGDECQWYCLSFVIDSTLGTFVNLAILHAIEKYTRSRPSLFYLKFGEYGNPPKFSWWAAQLTIWLVVVTLGKIICISILANFASPLNLFIEFLFQALRGHPEVELIVVMIIVPMIFNVACFWVTDTFLKQSQPHQSLNVAAVHDLDDRLLDSTSAKESPREESVLYCTRSSSGDLEFAETQKGPGAKDSDEHLSTQASPLFKYGKASPRSPAQLVGAAGLPSSWWTPMAPVATRRPASIASKSSDSTLSKSWQSDDVL